MRYDQVGRCFQRVVVMQRVYEVFRAFGSRFRFLADLVEASAPLFLLDDEVSGRVKFDLRFWDHPKSVESA